MLDGSLLMRLLTSVWLGSAGCDLAYGRSSPVSSHRFDSPKFITKRLISDSFIASFPLRYFDKFEESMPTCLENSFCVSRISLIIYRSLFIISSLLYMVSVCFVLQFTNYSLAFCQALTLFNDVSPIFPGPS